MSTHVLQLMRKGCTMLQNVRLLKWCRYYGIFAGWNLLHGFPGETTEDYRRQLDVLKRITHLQPPEVGTRVQLDRFAPYYTEQSRFPIDEIRPLAGYRYIYPSGVDLDKIANFFDCRMNDTVPEESHRETLEWVDIWRRRWSSERPDSLIYWRTPEALFIEAKRGETRRKYIIDGPTALTYEYCSETMRTVAQVRRHLQFHARHDEFDDSEISELLEDLCCKGLMLSEAGRYLSLAVPKSPSWFSANYGVDIPAAVAGRPRFVMAKGGSAWSPNKSRRRRAVSRSKYSRSGWLRRTSTRASER